VSETPEPVHAVPLEPGLHLHQRLLAGDVTASAEIAEAYLPPLVAHLQTHNPGVDDPHLPATAAIDALQNYLQRPEQYNPEKGSLEAYLRMAASGDLKNALSKQARERQNEGGERIVELDAPGAEYQVEANAGPSVEEQVEIRASPVWRRIREWVPDPVDQQIVQLMVEKVRKTSAFARVLGITHLSPEEQAEIVKRHKDRLKKRLQRHMRLEEMDGD